MSDFRSDNTLGCSPEIIEALARASTGSVSSYGNDDYTARVRQLCSAIFETDVAVFPVLTGTAGNALSIAAITPPWGAVFCHEDAHIQRDELGAPEFYSLGAKLIPVAGADGKVHARDLEHHIAEVNESRRQAVSACISLTNATEAGTVYTAAEMREIGDVAKRMKVRLHLDGARFANAVVATGAAPADLTWRAGVDILVFGATKNGAMAAEAIVVFRKELAEELAIRYHRGGHRLSKMRFLSAQLEAYLTAGVWLRNAQHANAAAARMRAGLEATPGVTILRPVDANIVFVRLEKNIAGALHKRGYQFHDWPIFGEGAYRLVTGFSTTELEVDRCIEAARSAAMSVTT